MLVKISLHSDTADYLSYEKTKNALNLLRPTTMRVSRTIGPADYYSRTKSSIDGSYVFPPTDIDYIQVLQIDAALSYLRKDSVLSITCQGSPIILSIAKEIAHHSERTSMFFESSSGFQFGPTDILDYRETEGGEFEPTLIAVATVTFSISTDNFPANPVLLTPAIHESPTFQSLRRDLDHIFGPMQFMLS